ncbi:MAG: heme lyase CcmF/NrfE family subunit [Anaerolineae bacterium]|nr:heme lyase CcmF/NrfE family subunit [Anaerolineae bacterium]
MIAEVAFLAALLAFVVSLYAVGASLWGSLRIQNANGAANLILSSRNAAYISFPLLLLSCGMLIAALVSEQYQMSYVWQVTNPQTPLFYRITGLWGSQAGSLLFWCTLMSGFAAGAVLLNWRKHPRLMPFVIAATMATLAFFLALVLFFENPFERFWIMPDNSVLQSAFVPSDGVPPLSTTLAESANGLNPLLRHFGMIVHPPLLYLGFVGFIIPFAFSLAGLASGDLSTGWIKASRRWALVAWVCLSLGLLLGGRWAYDVLGWGGYWGWDPVENAAFLPWLIGTAYLHSVMIQEKRGMLKVWNLFLVIMTFSAVVFGTFATRSGLVDSVHSFARSSIGFPLFFFWLGMTVIAVSLIFWRWRRGELRDEHRFSSLLGRESLFVLNNIVFVLLFIAIFWGSFGAPVISELFFNTNITLGKDYFLSVTPPLFLALFLLMGVAPLSAWGVTSLRKLGRGLLIPLVLTLVLVALLSLITPMTPVAVIGYVAVGLAGFVALYETYRGAAARHRGQHESWVRAFSALIGRNRRRYGGYLIHFAIAMIGIGVIGSTLFQQETQRTLKVGESLELSGYTLTYDRFFGGQVAEDDRVMDIAQMTVSRNGQVLSQIRPRRDFYPNTEGMNSMTIAGAYSTLESDVYVLLVSWESVSASSATFKVYLNPLINWIWWGGILLVIGTLVAVWSDPVPALLPTRSASTSSTVRRAEVTL